MKKFFIKTKNFVKKYVTIFVVIFIFLFLFICDLSPRGNFIVDNLHNFIKITPRAAREDARPRQEKARARKKRGGKLRPVFYFKLSENFISKGASSPLTLPAPGSVKLYFAALSPLLRSMRINLSPLAAIYP